MLAVHVFVTTVLPSVPVMSQIFTVGDNVPLNAPAFHVGSVLGFLTIGGRKKKSGLPDA